MTAASQHPVLTALSAALGDASNLLRVPVEEIAVDAVEAREWPDSCLGLPADGELCADVVTPGYFIRFADGFNYRADQHGNVRREGGEPTPDTEIRLRYSVLGGIGGWHSEYETDSRQLTESEERELRRLITAADFFNVKNFPPTSIVSDGITSRLWIAVGRREHEVVRGDGIKADDTAAMLELAAWAADRTPPLFPRRPV